MTSQPEIHCDREISEQEKLVEFVSGKKPVTESESISDTFQMNASRAARRLRHKEERLPSFHWLTGIPRDRRHMGT